MKHKSFSSLPASYQRLVRLMQLIGFGRIENLSIRNGLPVFDPPPRVIEDVKFGAAENGARTEVAVDDFTLKQQIVELIDHLARVGNGVVESMMIKHGLPFSMSVELVVFVACSIAS